MAEGNFGRAEFDAHSSKGKPFLRTQSQMHPGRVYRWQVKKTKPNGDVFLVCNDCRVLKERRNSPHTHRYVPNMKVSDGILRVDPDRPVNAHFCAGVEKDTFTATELHRVARIEMIPGIKRPTRAYEDMCAKVPRLTETPEFRRNVENKLPAFKSMRPSLNRWRTKENAQYDQIEEIPENHKRTLATIEEPPERAEYYIIYQNVIQRILVLGSQADIRALAVALHLICDGTFKYCPRGFAQLYAIHAMVENDLGFEWKVVAIALLPDKSQATYELMFQQIRQKMLQLNPNQEPFNGNARATVHFDFELAAINACKDIFPEAKVCGCQFHYGQCHVRHAQACGLFPFYLGRGEPYNSPDFALVKRFIDRTIALTMLPSQLERQYWDFTLRNSMPVVDERAEGDPQHDLRVALNHNLRRYRDYVEHTWLTEDKIALANQFYNTVIGQIMGEKVGTIACLLISIISNICASPNS